MLKEFESFVSEKYPLVFTVVSLIAVALMGMNSYVWFSPWVGLLASFLYFAVNCIFWEKVFLREHDPLAVKAAFGILVTVALCVVIGTLLVVSYVLDVFTVLIMLSSISIFGYAVNKRWGRERIESKRTCSSWKFRVEDILCLAYLGLAICCFAVLIISRKEMTRSVWEALDPVFMPIYLITTLLLVGIVLLRRVSVNVKLPFIAIHGFLTLMFPFAYALAPLHDPWISLATSRWVYITGHIPGYPRAWLYNPLNLPIPLTALYTAIRHRAQSVLTVIFARTFGVDVFWVHLTLIPALWGLFVPFIAYGISFKMTKKRSIAVLSALLSYANLGEILWGAWHSANSLGFFFIFFQVYCLTVYLTTNGKRYTLLALTATVAAAFAHPSMGILGLSFLILAVAYKNRIRIKWGLGPALSACVLFLPLLFWSRRFIYPDYAYFSLSIVSKMDLYDAMWKVIFGDHFVYQASFRLVFLSGLVLLLGLIGAVQLLLRRGERNPRIAPFLLALVLVVELDNRICSSFMINVPISPSRILKVSYFILLVLMAVPIYHLYKTLSKHLCFRIRAPSKKHSHTSSLSLPLGDLLIIISISCLIIANVIEAYSLSNFRGLQPTSFELDVSKFIQEDADGEPYMVLTSTRQSQIGASYVGLENPEAHYFTQSSTVMAKAGSVLSAIRGNDPLRGIDPLNWLLMVYSEPHYIYFIVGSPAAPQFRRYVGEPREIFVSPSEELPDQYLFRISRDEIDVIVERAMNVVNVDFEDWTDSMPDYWMVTMDGNVTLRREDVKVFNGTYSVYGKAISTGGTEGSLKLSQLVSGEVRTLKFSFYLINHTQSAGRLHVVVQDPGNTSNYVVSGFSFADLAWGEIGQGTDFRKYRKSMIVEPEKWYTIEWNLNDDWMKVFRYTPKSVVIFLQWITASRSEGAYTEAVFDALSIER